MNSRFSRYYTFVRPLLRNKGVKTYSSIIFSLITIMVFIIFALKPTISTILVLQKNLEEQQLVLQSLQDKVKNLSLGKTNLDKVDSSTKQKLNTLIPNQTDPATLANSLTALAISSQASISGLQFQPTPLISQSKTLSKKYSLQTIDFTFNVVGSYEDLVTLLQRLNSSARLISISSISFNQAPDSPLVMSINAKAYYLKN